MPAPSLSTFYNGVGGVSGSNLNTFQQTCDNFAQLRAFVGVTGNQVFARGAVTFNDGLQGDFVWNGGSTAPDDNNNVIAPIGGGFQGRWIRVPISIFAGSNVASLITYTPSPTGAVETNVAAKFQQTRVYTPEDFGAKGDVYGPPGAYGNANGVNPNPTDDTAALMEMFAAADVNTRFELGKVYAFSSTLVMPAVNYVTIRGENKYSCGFFYIGTSTTVDLIKLGDASRETNGWVFDNIIVDSQIQMTAGAAIHAYRIIFCEFQVVLHGQYGNLQYPATQTNSQFRLWDGLRVEGFLYCSSYGLDIAVRNNGITLTGINIGGSAPASYSSYGAYFSIVRTKIGGCTIGLFYGGGVYDVRVDDIDIIGNITNNVRITQELYPHANAGGYFGPLCTIDSVQTGDSVYVNDPGVSGENVGFDLSFKQTWIASGPLAGINIVAAGFNNFNYVRIDGAEIGNFQGDGIKVQTSIPQIEILNTSIQVLNGVGINASAAGGASGTGYRNVRAKNITFKGVATNFSGNIEGFKCAWAASFGADSGTLPTQPTVSYAYYLESGPLSASRSSGTAGITERIAHFNIKFTMPASIGSASGQLIIELPWECDVTQKFYGIQGIGNTTLGPLYGIIQNGFSLRVIPVSGASSVKVNEEMEISGWYIPADNGNN